MLSSLSCRSGEHELSALDNSFLAPTDGKRQRSLASSRSWNSQRNRSVIDRPIIKNKNNGRVFGYLLLICVVLAMSFMKSSESRMLPLESNDSIWQDDTQGVPCFCDNHFYKSCPGKAICKKLVQDGLSSGGIESNETDSIPRDLHDFDHPDHVIDDIGKPDSLLANKANLDPYADGGGIGDTYGTDGSVAHNRAGLIDGDEETVVRHRKIYVAERPIDLDSVITKLSLVVPVAVKPDPTPLIPPPKPLFKMRKYTVHESKPQVDWVPVTTTVIKPVGATKDQFVENTT